MTKTVLVLGPTGRFARNAAEQFAKAGWSVRPFKRGTDSLERAARGVDVIVNGWNPPYSKWASQSLKMQSQVHRAALANDATVVIPGNVYVFGYQAEMPWSESTPHRATNDMCRIRIDLERGYREAGVRTLVLRAGDYLDTEPSGNWFDKVMVAQLHKGWFTSPGAPDVPRAFGFLPDLARAAVQLCEKRDTLAQFEDVCFPGYTLTASEMASMIATTRGQDVRVSQLKWWQLRLLQPVWAEVTYIFQMRYIWDVAHRLDGAKFDRLLPEFEHTEPHIALDRATAHIPLPKSRAQMAKA